MLFIQVNDFNVVSHDEFKKNPLKMAVEIFSGSLIIRKITKNHTLAHFVNDLQVKLRLK